MAFSLTTVPTLFQYIIDTIFQDIEVCNWYFNNILIYNGNTKAEHRAMEKKVLQPCVKHRLAENFFKRKFHAKETLFLGQVINSYNIKMDPTKLETISKWQILTRKIEVQLFLSFANDFCRLIVNYSTKGYNIITFTNDIPFN